MAHASAVVARMTRVSRVWRSVPLLSISSASSTWASTWLVVIVSWVLEAGPLMDISILATDATLIWIWLLVIRRLWPGVQEVLDIVELVGRVAASSLRRGLRSQMATSSNVRIRSATSWVADGASSWISWIFLWWPSALSNGLVLVVVWIMMCWRLVPGAWSRMSLRLELVVPWCLVSIGI